MQDNPQILEYYENPKNMGSFDDTGIGAATNIGGTFDSSNGIKLNVTESAAKKIKQQLQKRGKGLGILVGVKTTGCSGLQYVLEFLDNEHPHCVEHHDHDGVRIFMDPKYRPYLWGTTIDYVRNGLNEGFKFINPNERDRCGCGSSFRI
jgi:iron-sulfur cluster assembly protein